ncbi:MULTISPECIES: DMT family transporter [unclassified Streptomyces]|uniref:DMT family transporter n=1 Tax=unclassified Streptomyces TaxID=2593676 RepID=UPI0001B549C4|nr:MULTISPECIES: DMT family transporter [unclassified Streptomyces]MYR25411.1 EamA family transporter [Streptomyces sp. SID4945]
MFAVRRTDAVLVLVALVWGSSYLVAKSATDVLPVLAVLFARYALGALACGAVVLVRRRAWTRTEVRAGALLGVTQAAVLVLETYGVAHTSAAHAGLLISLTIVLTPPLDRTRPPLPARFYAAALLCVVAVGLIGAGGEGFGLPRGGDLLMLGAAVVRAGHVALVGRVTARHRVDPVHLTTVQMVTGTVLVLPFAVRHFGALAASDAATGSRLLYLALLCGLFAFLAQTWAVQRTSASRASLLLGTEPVWAVATGLVVGGERLTPWAAAGAALLLVGTYWGQAVERAHRDEGPGQPPYGDRPPYDAGKPLAGGVPRP